MEVQYVQNVYDAIANHFDQTRPFQWSWITDFIISKDSNYFKILDIGCGNGRNMKGFINSSVMGLDNSEGFINICTNKGLHVIKADMCKIPFPTNNFDHLMCIAAFHHLTTVERRIKALREMRRILKPKGQLLLSVWSIEQPEKTRRKFMSYGDTIVPWNKKGILYDRYYYIFQIDEIVELFTKTGFSIKERKWDCGNEIFILGD